MQMKVRKRWLRFGATISLIALSLSSSLATPSESRCSDDAMLVFDGSGSMAEMGFNGLDQPRITEARAALRQSLPEITPHRDLGLIVYGPGAGDVCSNVDLRFEPSPNAAKKIISEIDGIIPDGNTPLTRAVEDAADALKYKEKAGVVVLITDGKETCGGAPCQLASKLAATAKDLVVHVIGFKVRSAFFTWNSGENSEASLHNNIVARCLADRTGGLYTSTESTEELVEALRKNLACPFIG